MLWYSMSFCYTVTTQKSVNDAITNLTHNLKEIGFGVLEVLDFKKILNERDQEFQNEYKLMDVCNPKLAKQIDVGQGPHGIRASEDGSKVYVGITREDEIVIIDAETLEITQRLSVGKVPFWLAVPQSP